MTAVQCGCQGALESWLSRPKESRTGWTTSWDARPQRAALALGALRRPLSLTGGEEGEQLEIPVEAPEEQTAERLTLYAIIEGMEGRDRELIRCRYFRGMTQAKTAQELGMTQVQVSRREKKLLEYMRREFGEG